MLFELLPQADVEKIEKYIDIYAGCDVHNAEVSGMGHILRHWDLAKQKLFHAFGDEFIIKQPICWEMNDEDKITRMKNAISNTDAINRFVNEFRYNAARKFPAFDEYDKVIELVNPQNMSKNIYCGDNFSVVEPVSGKKIQVQKGASIMKTLIKFAKPWGLEEKFEDMRLAHSTVLNDNHIRGNLCLSIHPLDFMTMSDNDTNWTSCMSWTSGRGCHKQGTVEMMNSKYAVVAYLESATPYNFNPNEEDKMYWNNKKWREIILVDNDFVAGIKGYPFHNYQLEEYCVDWAASLMTTMGAEYWPAERIEPFAWIEKHGCKFSIEFTTAHMYNDFGNTVEGDHYMYLGKDVINPNRAPVQKSTPRRSLLSFVKPEAAEIVNIGGLYYEYSGVSECVWCGCDLHDYWDDAHDFEFFDSMLVCCECSGVSECQHCGEPVLMTEMIEHDGYHYCQYCYDSHFTTDDMTGEWVHEDSVTTYALLPCHDYNYGYSWNFNTMSTAIHLGNYKKSPNSPNGLETHWAKDWTYKYILIDDIRDDWNMLSMFSIDSEGELADYIVGVEKFFNKSNEWSEV